MGAPKHVKQISKDINGETDNNIINTVTVRDVNTLLTSTERSSRQKITKATMVLNGILNQVDLLDSCSTLQPKPAEYTFFSSVHGTFSRIYHILGQKTSVNKFNRIEIIASIFSNNDWKRITASYSRKNITS